MSNSGSGLQPRPSPWYVDELRLDGSVVLVRTVWRSDSQANPYQPHQQRKSFASQTDAEAFIGADIEYPLHERRTPTGLAGADKSLWRLHGSAAERAYLRSLSRRPPPTLDTLADDYARRARRAGWHVGGWA